MRRLWRAGRGEARIRRVLGENWQRMLGMVWDVEALP